VSAPSIVMVYPVPSMTNESPDEFAIAGSVLVIVIVPLTLNLIVSLPVATAQSPPLVSVPGLFELSIASRKLHVPSPDVLSSLVVFTTIWLRQFGHGRDASADDSAIHPDATRIAIRIKYRERMIFLTMVRLGPLAVTYSRVGCQC